MPEIAVGLMAKYPEKGHVKTRLAKQTETDTALDVYKQLLAASVSTVVGLDHGIYHRAAFVEPGNRVEQFAKSFPTFDTVLPQRGTDLGEKMLNALAVLLRAGNMRGAMLIGTDIPDIDGGTFDEAVQLLAEHDLVLGPTRDGGYYLVGLKGVEPAIFSEIEWGTSPVFESTVAAAENAGLSIGLLPILADLDNLDDLEYFRKRGCVR
jgi:rSAM/selenodomain-associated transferase 1